jgi:hypothetical protein
VPEILAHDGKPDGWCCGQNIRMFGNLCGPDTRVIIELGSWLGRSTMHLLEAAPNATILCVDHWLGSAEHQTRPEWKEKLPRLYETFLRHHWPSRDRIVPMRMDTVEGMHEIAKAGVKPDLVYVDASHDADSVCRDLSSARLLFPSAQLCGDDWTFETVRAGVQRAIRDWPDQLITDEVCWWLVPH